MVGFKFAATLLIAGLPLASAYIDKVANITGTFHATDDSKLPVTFINDITKVYYVDLTATFALGRASQKGQFIGLPLYNFDFTTLPANVIGNETFTIEVPLTKTNISVFGDEKSLALNVIISHADGSYPNLTFYDAIYRLPFTATIDN
ncbi:hypothetical protein EXIGLDRAFT_745705 [Exidia glandulosa HHB12029]|uniref:Secreted protein n=1 Tax=Exidia glandulosa HHB12029 TaxID=1314781 RepID=A0A166BDX6_EXIGL|nr:hypothetical protein EXIGLDRAFT_745705 [Exidia glandulosa HHB12029]